MGDIASAADYVAALLALTAGVSTAFGAGGKASTLRSYLTIALCAIAVALSLAAPATSVVIGRSMEIENVIRLAGSVFALIGSWCALAIVAYSTNSVSIAARRVRLAGGVMIACVGVMVVLLLTARTPATVELATVSSTNLSAVVYEGLYAGYMCWGMFGATWLICRSGRPCVHRIMRLSMCLYLSAGSTGLIWTGWQIATVVVVTVVKRSLTDQCEISDTLASVAIGLIISGVAVQSSARWIVLARAWHDYHTLGPLWRRVTIAVPEVLLPHGSVGKGKGVEYALYRRVIEIRDAQWILRRYRDPRVSEGVAQALEGLKPAHAELVVEATELAAALAGHLAGRRYQTDAPSMWVPQRRPIGSLRAEGRWLVRVARAVGDGRGAAPALR